MKNSNQTQVKKAKEEFIKVRKEKVRKVHQMTIILSKMLKKMLMSLLSMKIRISRG